ncbi:MAG: acetate kinase [Campylobacterota bacterium]|nr:acetate kinase [Campylobacterota bacterium]
MLILVLNSGSSSIKYKLFCSKNYKVLFEDIEEEVEDFHISFENIFTKLLKSKVIKKLEDISFVGHRVVHGGEKFSKPVMVTKKVIKELEKLIVLAPLHNPSNIDGIKTIKSKLPKIPQVVVFDTAFHHTIPKKNFLYPLPIEYYNKYKIRKYGFHGTSVEYVANKFTQKYNKKLKDLNLIVLHLGNGASITAIKNGKSYDTSMGFTPLEGLMMGTRSGDIDPAILLFLENQLKLNLDDINNILNKQSGFKGVCGQSDLRKIIQMGKDGDENSKLAIEMYVDRIRKYLASYILKLKNIDGIIFTGGIGENSSLIRKKVCKGLDLFVNIGIDVIKTDEEKNIAIKTYKLIKGKRE